MEQIPANIKHMVAVAHGNSAAVQRFLLTLKTSLLCPYENHCQLFPLNIVIDIEYAGQQIKCQV